MVDNLTTRPIYTLFCCKATMGKFMQKIQKLTQEHQKLIQTQNTP